MVPTAGTLAWTSNRRHQSEGLQDLPHTCSPRGHCGDSLPSCHCWLGWPQAPCEHHTATRRWTQPPRHGAWPLPACLWRMVWRHRLPLPGASWDNATTGSPGTTELAEDLLLRAERSPPGASKAKKAGGKPPRRTRGRNCHIRNLMVKVRDLGLGFNSDEIVLFKYCSGSCHRARSNYDLTLGSLLRQQLIAPGPQERVLSHPCCRPTRYEAVSFMDVENTWQTVEKLSAAECSCIG
uniref:Artemin n=1 Tax=Taeniopygia guttata TaxID=59729 RepID=A0A674HV40_TAEGU